MTWSIETILFTVLGGLTIFSGLAVISERNPVHSVFFLVLTFCQGSALLILIGAEFMAMMFLIVYVGAIAVLFLFVVMMLTTQAETTHRTWVPLGTGMGMILLMQVIGFAPGWPTANEAAQGWSVAPTNWLLEFQSGTNVEVLGTYLYTHGFAYFMLAGLLLWVAMIGAIALTLHRREYVRKQEIADQVSQTVGQALLLKRWSN
uniref:NADH-ubiquinone oxidoreductase chain 6 n=1 Tax=Hemiarma marina TaxID=1848298 RepID=A0A679EPN8_9CRYP|nr:NADH dehydrogenase subunit 6 [Hemiarma marina]